MTTDAHTLGKIGSEIAGFIVCFAIAAFFLGGVTSQTGHSVWSEAFVSAALMYMAFLYGCDWKRPGDDTSGHGDQDAEPSTTKSKMPL